jgi:hypothetical protein
MTTPSLTKIREQQISWAKRIQRHGRREDYAVDVAANLFLGRLNESTQRSFQAADGAELYETTLKSGVRPAKMSSLLSSSALVVNFFDLWCTHDPAPLGGALGLDAPVLELRFEHLCQNYPVGQRRPNLDLLLMQPGRGVAIEAKFTEPYRSPGAERLLGRKYFTSHVGPWEQVGLTRAQALAESLRPRWEYLDVAQLLKHMLGLASDSCASVLLYLWYDTGLPDADRHRGEIDRFAACVAGDPIEFRSASYQDAFRMLAPVAQQEWVQYMTARYFEAASQA